MDNSTAFIITDLALEKITKQWILHWRFHKIFVLLKSATFRSSGGEADVFALLFCVCMCADVSYVIRWIVLRFESTVGSQPSDRQIYIFGSLGHFPHDGHNLLKPLLPSNFTGTLHSVYKTLQAIPKEEKMYARCSCHAVDRRRACEQQPAAVHERANQIREVPLPVSVPICRAEWFSTHIWWETCFLRSLFCQKQLRMMTKSSRDFKSFHLQLGATSVVWYRITDRHV